MSISNIKYNYRCDDILFPLGTLPKKGKDPLNLRKQNDNGIVTDTSTRTAPTEDHVPTPMQDIEMFDLINISSNINNDSDQSSSVISNHPSNLTILMDTLSSNDSLIKKANNKKKKKSKQEPKLVILTEVVQPHVPIDMLVDSSIHSLSFDTCVAIQRAQVTIKKDPCIKNIKVIKHKKEYLKSIKAEVSSSNRSQHTLSPPLEYTITALFRRMKLIPKTYYRMGRDKVSCREFKIINVPFHIELDTIEQAIRYLLKGETFYLRHPSKHTVDQKALLPAYFKKSDIKNRNKYVGKFTGFLPNYDLAYIKDHLQDVTNLKNVYRRTDDNNIYLEFASESDLFNACSSNIFIDKLKIKGISRGTNWTDRDAFLKSRCNKRCNSSPSTPIYATASNRGLTNLPNLNSTLIAQSSNPLQHSGPSQFELLSNLNILHNNINGLKHNPTKLTQLAEFALDSNAYIVGITETNIDSKASKFIPFNDYYKGYFSECDDKINGSGVVLLVHEIWLKHLEKIDSPNPYSLEATFYFKECTCHIGVVYMEPNNKSNTDRLNKMIKDKIKLYHRCEEPFIILGDFNTLRNKRLDHSRQKGHLGPANNLFIFFDELGYIDSFRELHPNTKFFSYTHDSTATRIDYI
ncbi:Endonuclease/exonuclease/phosphatase [Glomus cerebriforme]|uniref:Endonuclease/exonuclease/phosphatase n=1 Tax=Glomus cerebriforme TaxID=658196 RepID=A0A397TR11_9GLOM|nr:Endonuclease/exonuclease/phosphatase [Glomus cerebriforme]